MLNSETKRKIDAARQVLVGVLPNPMQQVEQITTALIYKFMDDMDERARKLGGKASFFTGDYKKYSWHKLMDTRLGNQERLNLYQEAITNISKNPNIPQLFREIFAKAYLPFNAPRVLGLFLSEIDGFDYSHSEELGNAYEYLLSIMGSQGDAGQFRTPRHIIDFIVEVVDPQKNERILDPACGTAGFLISAYKHILANHDGIDNKTGKKTKKEKPLTADERGKIHKNIIGYDIDSGMTRTAQVNMYLHGFKNPDIRIYDSLSDDKYWDEEYDVILANPPFMTPKGGIQPHSKFNVQAKRSEVLFVDYIIEHLNMNGRAGIIVPEGIIFQSATAYKKLRKMLVEDGLYAVVSLPSGVFQPYSGVKTSILLFDNKIAKQTKDIMFLKIKNDGYDLGAQRRKLDNNGELPIAAQVLKTYREGFAKGIGNRFKIDDSLDYLAWLTPKETIMGEGEYNLSGDRYRKAVDYSNIKWPIVKLKEVCDIYQPKTITSKEISKEEKSGWYKVFGANGIIGYYGKYNHEYPEVLITCRGATCGTINLSEHKSWITGNAMVVHPKENSGLLKEYLFYFLINSDLSSVITGAAQPQITRENLSPFKIPLPPLEIQKQIVEELDGYQKVIDGARQVVKNWKPQIKIDPEWEMVKLGDVFEMQNGRAFKKAEWKKEGIPIIRIANLNNEKAEYNYFSGNYDKKIEVNNNDLLFSWSGTVGTSFGPHYWTRGKGVLNQHIYKFVSKINNIDNKFAFTILQAMVPAIEAKAHGAGGLVHITKTELSQFEIPIPSLKIQKLIVDKIEAERKIVDANKELIKIYEHKIKDKISEVWGV